MDQSKIGNLIKELRKEKELTQEQLAEQFCVSRRTVSRWETGSNLPDLDILIEMSDYFNVNLRELLDGERSFDKTDKKLEDTILKVADYSDEKKRKLKRRMHLLFIAGCIAEVVYMVLLFVDKANNFFGGLCLGSSLAMLIIGAVMTSGNADKILNYLQGAKSFK